MANKLDPTERKLASAEPEKGPQKARKTAEQATRHELASI
jgi:hypothetical protein